jgi:hypothetical protein
VLLFAAALALTCCYKLGISQQLLLSLCACANVTRHNTMKRQIMKRHTAQNNGCETSANSI